MRPSAIILLAGFLLLAPPASAGSAEAPELTDDSGDAQPAATNQFADITAGWVNETSDAIVVNVQLASFPPEPPEGEIYSLLFHQDPTTCAAYYGGLVFNQSQPEFTAGTIDTCTGNLTTSQETTGTAPTSDVPVAVIQVPRTVLDESHRGAQLVNFSAVTFNFYPLFGCIGGSPACGPAVDSAFHDDADAPDAVYTLQQGPDPPTDEEADGNESAQPPASGSANTTTDAGSQADGNGSAGPEEENGSPGPGAGLAVALVGLCAALLRRRA